MTEISIRFAIIKGSGQILNIRDEIVSKIDFFLKLSVLILEDGSRLIGFDRLSDVGWKSLIARPTDSLSIKGRSVFISSETELET